MAPSDCPKGDNIFRERAEEGVCKVCGQREEERREEGRVRRDGERRGVSRERHSKERHGSRGESVERHDVRDESLESVSSVRSDSTERGDRHREKDRGDGHDKSKGDGGQEKKDKKKNDKGGSWDATLGLVLQGLEYAAS
jgi:hypothetical protein